MYLQLITGKGTSVAGSVSKMVDISNFGLERCLEFYQALVKTFEDIYHNEEEIFNWGSMKEVFCFLSLITHNLIVAMVVFIIAITLLGAILLQKSSWRH